MRMISWMRRKEPQRLTYNVYIRRVLKKFHPDIDITAKSLAIVNSFINDMFNRICADATRIASIEGRKTIKMRDMDNAIKLVMPDGLAKRTVSAGIKALTKYKESGAGRSRRRRGVVERFCRTL
uniref:Histone H2A/H2B/H3 domain-containing protein n=1 Tax=Globodera rostochiensis TaxID=31243 RepID=A0A914H4K7_GLORO